MALVMKFVADCVLSLDPKNPQVAARLSDRVPQLACARAHAARARRSFAASRGRQRCPFARRTRHRRAVAGRIVRPPPDRQDRLLLRAGVGRESSDLRDIWRTGIPTRPVVTRNSWRGSNTPSRVTDAGFLHLHHTATKLPKYASASLDKARQLHSNGRGLVRRDAAHPSGSM